MPQAQLTNIAGADGEGFNSGPVMQDVYNSSTSTVILNGTLVQLITPITTTTTTIFAVKIATTTTTQAPLNIGIASGTEVTASGTGILAPGVGQAAIHGHTRALFDATTSPTVAGHYAILGTTTAGSLTDSGGTTAAAGLDYGVVLEAVTISSGQSLVNIWFEKT
jgi:hypothetical protein